MNQLYSFSDRKADEVAPKGSNHGNNDHQLKTWLTKMHGVVISVQEPLPPLVTDAGTGKQGYERKNCDSCCKMMGMNCAKGRVPCAPHCQGQFTDAHEEADRVEDFFRCFGNLRIQRLRNPSREELDECFSMLIQSTPDDPTEAVLIYYIGHGVEFNGSLHAVLVNGMGGRTKYDLEGRANELAKKRLVHAMFDCNRLYWKNETPNGIEATKIPKNSRYIYLYSAFSGKYTKALNSSSTYIRHLRTQAKDTGMMFPSAIAFLNGHGSMNCIHNVKRPLYAPISL